MTPAYRGARLQLELPVLAAGDRHLFEPPTGEEGVVVLLAGDVAIDGAPAQRSDVFAARATAAYVPPGRRVEVVANAPTELAFVTTVGLDAAPNSDPKMQLVGPDAVHVQRRGRPGWAREVHDVVTTAVPAQRLLVGETFNEPGQWSSFPPHKHDGDDGEPALEEVYYYRFDPPDGFGFQGLYDAQGNERAELVRHGRVVGIPRGYHPVCSAPGYRLYYLWALAGSTRELVTHEDPAYSWLASAHTTQP
jgi:5-deoxy-glucuronate isomerase